MTIAFPRELPDPGGLRGASFDLRYAQARALARGGLPQVIEIGRPLWDARYETYALAETQVAAWEAWTASLRGGRRLFRAWHPLRRYGLAYRSGYDGMTRAGGGAFDGTATLASVGAALDTMTISGLPAGLVISAGDMLSFAHVAVQSLHRVVEGATASGGGGATVAVEPEIIPSPPANAAVSLVKAWCNAVIDPSTMQLRWTSDRRAIVTFQAMQALA